mgnify:CR=1 FL=1
MAKKKVQTIDVTSIDKDVTINSKTKSMLIVTALSIMQV